MIAVYQGPRHARLTIGKAYQVQGFVADCGGALRLVLLDDNAELYRSCNCGDPDQTEWQFRENV